ncbi:MAG: hypothetical protein L0Y66_06385 [Myxococcaceae bacterium]|nr:hypothetical protein [Myxococcaceae bacterium]MCI0669269.1 hypothetical protein [Myxococcaceae bacterium]
MSRTRPLLLLALLAAAPVVAAPGSPTSGDVEVRVLLREALETHAVPPAELPRLPEAATPATPGRPEQAPGKGVKEKASAHASARAREVLEQLRLGKSPARAGWQGKDVEAATAQERIKKARRQAPLPGAGGPNSPGNNASSPDKPGPP